MQPDMFGMAWHALTLLLEPMRLLILVLGVVIGLAIGVLPGLSGIVHRLVGRFDRDGRLVTV